MSFGFRKSICRGVCICAALALGACGDLPDLSSVAQKTNLRPVEEAISVARGNVTIAGPKGYCVDRSSSSLAGETVFVVMGSCSSLAGDDNIDAPGAPNILTASVAKQSGAGPIDDAMADDLRGFFERANGKAVLARDGNPASIQIQDSLAQDGLLMLRLEDKSAGIAEGLDDVYWRGLFVMNERLVTISVFDFSSHPRPSEASLGTLRAFYDRIRQESASAATTEQQNGAKKIGLRLFRRKQ